MRGKQILMTNTTMHVTVHLETSLPGLPGKKNWLIIGSATTQVKYLI